MNYKINLAWFFLLQILTFVIIFLAFNIIPKHNYTLTNLQVNKIESFNEFQQPINCEIILNWKNKNANNKQEIKKIQKITSLDQKININLEKYNLSWKNDGVIKINGFNNQCKWWSKSVIVTTQKTTLWNYLIKQIINF